jgi:hypothetical protein
MQRHSTTLPGYVSHNLQPLHLRWIRGAAGLCREGLSPMASTKEELAEAGVNRYSENFEGGDRHEFLAGRRRH